MKMLDEVSRKKKRDGRGWISHKEIDEVVPHDYAGQIQPDSTLRCPTFWQRKGGLKTLPRFSQDEEERNGFVEKERCPKKGRVARHAWIPSVRVWRAEERPPSCPAYYNSGRTSKRSNVFFRFGCDLDLKSFMSLVKEICTHYWEPWLQRWTLWMR